jgi:hypothetical protein
MKLCVRLTLVLSFLTVLGCVVELELLSMHAGPSEL